MPALEENPDATMHVRRPRRPHPRRPPVTASSGDARAIYSSADARSTYEPLDTPKPLAEGIWTVDSGPLRALGLKIPLRMTVIRLSSGDILLHSPTRPTAELRAALEAIGPIRHLVAPSIAHWMHVKSWQELLPDATVSAAPGLRARAQVKAKRLRIDRDLGDTVPPEWQPDLDQALLQGGLGVAEVAFFHKPSRTLVLTDLIQNFEPRKLGGVERVLFTLSGSMAPEGKTPMHLRAILNRNRGKVAAAARRMIAWAPERIVVSHGRIIERDGTNELRRRLKWLL